MRTIAEVCKHLKIKDREILTDAYGNEWMVRCMEGNEFSLYGIGDKRHVRNVSLSYYACMVLGLPGLERKGITRAREKLGRPRIAPDKALVEAVEGLATVSERLGVVRSKAVDIDKIRADLDRVGRQVTAIALVVGDPGEPKTPSRASKRSARV